MKHLPHILTLLLPLIAFANPTTELSNINKNITTIQTDLKKSTLQKSQLQTALLQTENTEGKVHAQITTTQKTLKENQTSLATLKIKEEKLTQEKNKYHALLKEQIQAAYLLSQQPEMKTLLSSNTAQKTPQLLMDYQYIVNEQKKTIQKLEQAIVACHENQAAILHTAQHLEVLKKTQLKNQVALQQVQNQRQQLIQTINQHIISKHQQLTRLLWNKRQLEETLRELNVANTKRFISKKPLTHLHGKLPWPTQGTVRHHFGDAVQQSQLHWDGVVITAPQGQPVYAAASGRVIFSKWLAGYGLLLIIDDGNGYMTLYGRNQSIMEKVGDTVKTGEEIATVGKSGGFLQPGLYFSIRHNGQALNPAVWLTAHRKHA